MNQEFDCTNTPNTIKVGKRFRKCLIALVNFFGVKAPAIITDRSTNIQMAVYGFVDASKSGFVSSIDYGNQVTYRMGIWGRDTENDSSNYREFANLVEILEMEAEDGRLDGTMLIIATDNSTVESDVYKGNSSNEKLFKLIVRLRLLELKVGGKIIISHDVSGKRLVYQGTDGISRGHLREGIMVADMMLDFCHWHQLALDRSPLLINWITSVFGKKTEVLSPEGWYTRGHDYDGHFKDENGFMRLHFCSEPTPGCCRGGYRRVAKS